MTEAETPEELLAEWQAEAPEPAGPLSNLTASLVVIGLGIAGAVLAMGLGIGSISSPGPGTWPLVICVALVLLGVLQLVVGRRGREDGERFSRYSWLALAGLVSLVAMAVLMPMIGFEIPAFVLCIVWMKFLGGESWRSTILYSAIVVVAFYAIFIAALGTSIPHLI
ncbi:tripartite tricarboxylate transporter TctB family protein [Micrococcus sp. HG099]|uniref:tripartite tricarboxylate transporter TctB family protein n=1 Tax=Micrococcus sp. HG099 TaxID=2969755 RepID=UPI00215ACDDF|nr:tripartite tricarboxylate transporter TctB family protein [Micrococcus sp. HG099]MCR8674562.1 tripartite tricarboxylate transporter TctB family protein [Micrococcus sp. HG099]